MQDINSSWISTGVSSNPWYTSSYYTTCDTSSIFGSPVTVPKIEEPVSDELKINIKKSQIKFNFNL